MPVAECLFRLSLRRYVPDTLLRQAELLCPFRDFAASNGHFTDAGPFWEDENPWKAAAGCLGYQARKQTTASGHPAYLSPGLTLELHCAIACARCHLPA